MTLPRSTPLRHPRFRACGIEVIKDRAPEVYKELIDALWYMVGALPTEWQEVCNPEICGSSAFMIAKPWSDFDINLSTKNWKTLVQLDFMRRSNQTLWQRSREVQEQLGVLIQCGTRTVSAGNIATYPEKVTQLKRKYDSASVDDVISDLSDYIEVPPSVMFSKYPLYDVRTEKFYNKEPYQVFPHTLKWSVAKEWWDVLPQKQFTAGFHADPYADEVEPWKTLYGEYYLDVEPYIVPENLEE